MNHELKIWPQFYHAVREGKKNFEVRKNDRAYQAGDSVSLREWDPAIVSNRPQPTPSLIVSSHRSGFEMGDYTGSPIVRATIGYVLPIDAERVVFSLLDMKVEGK